MAITGIFNPTDGVLTALGDALDDTITASRDAAGKIFINGGAVPIIGGTPTVANTATIQLFGQDGNDTITLNEANGALPAADLFGDGGRTGQLPHVGDRAVERAADQELLVLRSPRSAEPGHHLGLGLQPEPLGVEQQPVHVEQDRLQHPRLPFIPRAEMGK